LRTVRTRTHKLTVELGTGAGEMYHLGEDPFEMQNLFDDPGYRGVRQELMDMVHSRPADVRPDLPEPVGMA